jgi:hypothetical protein
MGQPFGTVAVKLPKADYGLDEDGVIYVRTRLSVRHARKFVGGAELGLDDLLPLVIAGWSIKANGIELPYSEDNTAELPVEMLEAINEHIQTPLADSVRSMNGRSRGSGSPAPSGAPDGAKPSMTAQ